MGYDKGKGPICLNNEPRWNFVNPKLSVMRLAGTQYHALKPYQLGPFARIDGLN